MICTLETGILKVHLVPSKLCFYNYSRVIFDFKKCGFEGVGTFWKN